MYVQGKGYGQRKTKELQLPLDEEEHTSESIKEA